LQGIEPVPPIIFTAMEKYRTLLSRYFAPHLRQAVLLGLLLLIVAGLRLAGPQILRDFIDTAVAHGSSGQMLRQAAWYLGIAILIQLLAVIENWLATNIGLLATNHLRADLARHCLDLDMSFHKQHTPGEMIERVDGDVGKLSNFFSRFVVEIVGSVVLIVGILILMFVIDWRVGLVFSLFSALTLLLMNRLKDVAVPYHRKARQSNAELFGFLEERLTGTEDVRANGATAYVLRRFYEYSRPVIRNWAKAGAVGVLSFGSTWVLFAIGSAVSLALGAYLFQNGLVTIGTVFLIFRYADLLNRPLESLVRQFEDLQQAGASAIRVLDLLALHSAIADTGKRALPGNENLALELENVSFAYQDGNPGEAAAENVLNQINFHLPPGTILGLLGRTGSGKTTLTRLLVRFYDPAQGVLHLGGVPLPEIPLAHLRSRIGLVTQDIQLFNASLRDNLTLFDPAIPDQRIFAAFDELGLMDWYRTLPEGLETRLEPGGSRLSAGEAQLLAFVRVFLRDPGLIILDEASSRLDPATEARLDRAIERLLQGRTAIIIAHRLGTVQRADRILILENGCQLEFGERQALASDQASYFAALLRTGLEEALV
jgi:ATP-binding cassette, subfamily B, bacterial